MILHTRSGVIMDIAENENGGYDVNCMAASKTYDSLEEFYKGEYNAMYEILGKLKEIGIIVGNGKPTLPQRPPLKKATVKKPVVPLQKQDTQAPNLILNENNGMLNFEIKMQQVNDNIKKHIDDIYNAVNLPEDFKRAHENEIRNEIAREVKWDKDGNPVIEGPNASDNGMVKKIEDMASDKAAEEVGKWPAEKLLENTAKILGVTAEKTIGRLVDFLLEPTSMGTGDIILPSDQFRQRAVERKKINAAIDNAIEQVVYGKKPLSLKQDIPNPSDATKFMLPINSNLTIWQPSIQNNDDGKTYISKPPGI